MRKLFVFTILLCISLSTIWANGEQEAKSQDSEECKTIRFMTNETDPESVATDKYIIKLFEQKYPDTKICPEYITTGDMYEKAIIMATSGTNPDMMYTSTDVAVDAWLKGFTAPLDDVIDRIGNDFANLKNLTDQSTGEKFGIPVQSGTFLYWYRKDLAEKAGIKAPTSREEIINLISKMESEDIYGYTGIGSTHPNIQTPFYVNTWNDGKYVFSKDGSETLIHTKNRSSSKKTLAFLKELSNHAPPGFIGTGYTEAGADYINERAASLMLSTRLPSWIMAQDPSMLEKTAAVPVPATSGNEIYLWGGANVWTLFKNSKNIDRAKDFLVFFMTGERYAEFLQTVPMHLLPTRPQFASNEYYLDDPVIRQFKPTLDMVMNNFDKLRGPTDEYGSSMEGTGACWGSKALAIALNKFYAGTMDADEVLDSVGAEWNRILQEQ